MNGRHGKRAISSASITGRSDGAVLLNLPGVAGSEKLGEIAGAAFGDDVFDLLIHDCLVGRKIVPCAKNSDRSGKPGTMLHVREQEGVGGARVMRVMNE